MGYISSSVQLVVLKKGIDLVEKFEEWRPCAHFLFYGYTFYWLHPFRDCEVPLQQAQHAVFKFGVLEVYARSTCWYVHVQLMMGYHYLHFCHPLARIVAHWTRTRSS
jgi:hypothetical protein